MEFEEKFAEAHVFEFADKELIIAPRDVDADLSLDDHLIAVFERAGEGARIALEEDG